MHFIHAGNYNHTYASLGGIAETKNAYVLVGISEKKLSLDYHEYTADNRKNVFIQIMKKDWSGESEEGMQVLNTEKRAAVGKRPAGAQHMYLKPGTTDYGVLWLTDLTGYAEASCSEVFVNDKNQIVVMWNEYEEGFYLILSETGSIIKGKTSMGKCELVGYDWNILSKKGKAYWSQIRDNKIKLYVMDTNKTATRTGGYKGYRSIGGKNYYIDSKGYIKTGWVKVKNQYYYFTKDFTQVKNKTLKINGKNYKFNSKGVCTNRK